MPGPVAQSSCRGCCLAPVLLAAPHLLTMGTLSCNPDPRLTTAPQGWRAPECHVLETSLRKSCGMATLENGRLPCGGGRLWRWELVLLYSPLLHCVFWNVLGAQLEVGGSDKSLPFPKPQFSSQ